MTNEKYQCLVDATSDTGVTLPPIKPETEVFSHSGAYGPNAGRSGQVAQFSYTDANGSQYNIDATDYVLDHDGNPYGAHFKEYEIGPNPLPGIYGRKIDVGRTENVDFGEEY